MSIVHLIRINVIVTFVSMFRRSVLTRRDCERHSISIVFLNSTTFAISPSSLDNCPSYLSENKAFVEQFAANFDQTIIVRRSSIRYSFRKL